MKLYVKSKSKKAINEAIANGDKVVGNNYSIFGDGGVYALDQGLPEGTIIALYTKEEHGTPISRNWGVWDGKKVK